MGKHKKSTAKLPQNTRYKAERRHEKSNIKKLTAHLLRQPDDAAAQKALAAYKQVLGIV